jgi:hypothetical protein
MPRRGPSRGGGDTVRSRMLVQQRRQSRSVLGSLRDRQVSQATLVRYRQAVAQFFDWMQAHGHSVPDTTVGFDNMLASYAECLWQEGESRGLLASALCGLTLEVRSLHGRLKAAWHMHATWLKLEPSRRAPPLTPRLAQAFAGGFLLRGDVRTAGMIMLGFHCLMRNCEFMKLRIMDISIFPGGQGQLRLLHTKIGQRLGITEQVSVTDPWILEWLPAYTRAFPHTGCCMQLTDGQFRRTWSQIRAELGLPVAFTPYGIRRGGATHFFQECGSFSLVSDRGRWSTERATRIYVTSALQDLAALSLTGPEADRMAAALCHLRPRLERMTPQAAKRGRSTFEVLVPA